MNLDHYLTPYTKIKIDQRLKVRAKTAKLLKENICINLCDLGVGSGFFIYFILFIQLVVPGLSCGRRVPLVAARWLLCCSTQAPQLWHVGSLVVACMQDLVPWPGIEPGTPTLGAWSLNHCATREVPRQYFFSYDTRSTRNKR